MLTLNDFKAEEMTRIKMLTLLMLSYTRQACAADGTDTLEGGPFLMELMFTQGINPELSAMGLEVAHSQGWVELSLENGSVVLTEAGKSLTVEGYDSLHDACDAMKDHVDAAQAAGEDPNFDGFTFPF